MAARGLRLLAVAVAAAIVVAACGGDDTDSDAQAASSTTAGGGGGDIRVGLPAERCDANRKAGKLLFLTSFDYAAAASIADVVAAAEQGYYEDVCLDVELQPGFSTDNAGLVAAGRAQMTSMGSFSEVAVANGADADLVAVGVEGHTSIDELLVNNDSGVTELTDLTGKNIGIKGAIPFSIRAMLGKAGVDEGSLEQIEVGFNPVVLFEQDIAALPGYKSNEPFQLDAAGYKGRYRVFDPRDSDIPASFAVFATSQSYAKEHPTAVADFLRATLHGFDWAAENPDAAVAATLARSDPKNFFTPEGEKFRWTTEATLVKDTTPAGQPIGVVDRKQLAEEVDFLVSAGVIPKGKVDVEAASDPSFVEEVTEEGKVVWFG
jgi:ABC-type nitrate/sulfonate/bicarbonate transport system substrate-binding protein